MRSILALAAVALLSVCYYEPTSAAAPPSVALNPQPEPPGVTTLPPGPCKGANGRFMKCVVPTGATAQCKDTTFTTQKTRAGACAHHGGVAKWLVPSVNP